MIVYTYYVVEVPIALKYDKQFLALIFVLPQVFANPSKELGSLVRVGISQKILSREF